MRPNYLPTANPFGLAVPPDWFLAQLRAYDPDFVIFPSTHAPLYRTGRYGRFGYGLAMASQEKPDLAIFSKHGIWPWKDILPQVVSTMGRGWQKVLFDLRDYDTQQFSEMALESRLDTIEADAEAAQEKVMLATLDDLNRASYQTMKQVTGQKVGYGAKPEGAGFSAFPQKARKARRSSSYRPLGAGAGAMFVGR